MSVLLDSFDDAGLEDTDTRRFLLEALANADEDDWPDILEPFLSPADAALQALRTAPGVVAKSLAVLANDAVAAARRQAELDKVDPLSTFLLESLGLGVLAALGLHSVGSCSRVCRAASQAARANMLWQVWTEGLWRRWQLPEPATLEPGTDWRELHLSTLRPRADGIYVGESKYWRRVNPGNHMDLRKNSKDLALKRDPGEWIGYRRYVRLLPPEEDGLGWAMVLRDFCQADVAEAVLAGFDECALGSHRNPSRPDAELGEDGAPSTDDPSRLLTRIFVGRYRFLSAERRVDLRFESPDADNRMVFSLAHSGEGKTSDRLSWGEYRQKCKKSQEVTPIPLGRLPAWKGGGPARENEDHFPDLGFRPLAILEHLM